MLTREFEHYDPEQAGRHRDNKRQVSHHLRMMPSNLAESNPRRLTGESRRLHSLIPRPGILSVIGMLRQQSTHDHWRFNQKSAFIHFSSRSQVKANGRVEFATKREAINVLCRLQVSAEPSNTLDLLGKQADELTPMQESPTVSDHRSHRDRFGHVWDGKLQRDHIPHRQHACRDGTQSSLGKLEAPTVHTDISVPA
jgi:uncharacterized glyoxalase superfamily protein PhnB